MFTDLTFLYTSSSGPACDHARFCSQTACHLGFSSRAIELSSFSTGEMLAGGNFILFLGSSEDGELHHDAVPFWLELNSLNPGAFRHLRFAIFAFGNRGRGQFCALGNACNIKLGQLGGHRLHSFATCDLPNDSSVQEWLQAVLAKISPSRISRTEALAA